MPRVADILTQLLQTGSLQFSVEISHLVRTCLLDDVNKLNDMLFFQLFDPAIFFLSYLLDDSAEFNQVNTALISIFKIDAKGIHFHYALSALSRIWFLLILRIKY